MQQADSHATRTASRIPKHIARHLIATEIERLLTFLDAMDAHHDCYLEIENEGDGDCDDEPSLGCVDTLHPGAIWIDREGDDAETGIGDLDGLIEQQGWL